MTRHVQPLTTRAWIEIDLGAVRRNGAALAAQCGVPLLPMIKADAYGLGAVAVARALAPLAPWALGVATVSEGVELREAGVTGRILVFTPMLDDDLEPARAAALTPVLGRRSAIERWCATGAAWHLGVDTGMSRAGMRWDAVAEIHDLAARCPPEGACTHFLAAAAGEKSMRAQEQRFEQAVASLPGRPPLLHCENGVAAERRARSRWDLVRPGIFLYGVSGGAGALVRPDPVVHVRARVVDLRTVASGETVSYDATYRASGPRRIATLAAGYADGICRSLSNRGVALLHGRRAAVAGLVTMDMTMLDVTDLACEIGDVATLIGRDGDELLDVAAVAATAGVSPYELLTGLRPRLTRVYAHERTEAAA